VDPDDAPEAGVAAHRARAAQDPDEQQRRHHEHVRRGPALDPPEQLHAAVDDEDVERPEGRVAEPLRRQVPAELPVAERRRPPAPQRLEEPLERVPADPALDAEPPARHDGAHDRRHVRPEDAVRGAREDGEGDAVLGPRVRVEEDGDEDDRVADEDGDDGLPPRHPELDEPRGHHVGRDAVGEADPQRREGVRRPRALLDARRREVLVEEARVRERHPRGQLHPSVRVLGLLGAGHRDASYHKARYGLRPNILRNPFHMRRILSENRSSPRRKPLFATSLWPRRAICVDPAAGWKPYTA